MGRSFGKSFTLDLSVAQDWKEFHVSGDSLRMISGTPNAVIYVKFDDADNEIHPIMNSSGYAWNPTPEERRNGPGFKRFWLMWSAQAAATMTLQTAQGAATVFPPASVTAVSGPLTNAELRAAPVDVLGWIAQSSRDSTDRIFRVGPRALDSAIWNNPAASQAYLATDPGSVKRQLMTSTGSPYYKDSNAVPTGKTWVFTRLDAVCNGWQYGGTVQIMSAANAVLTTMEVLGSWSGGGAPQRLIPDGSVLVLRAGEYLKLVQGYYSGHLSVAANILEVATGSTAVAS